MQGSSILNWHLPENKQMVKEVVDNFSGQGQESMEAPLLTKDGRLIPIFAYRC